MPISNNVKSISLEVLKGIVTGNAISPELHPCQAAAQFQTYITPEKENLFTMALKSVQSCS